MSANGVQGGSGGRLVSLDVLRGCDLALLVLIQPVLYAFLNILQPAQGTFLGLIYSQLEHVPWEGICFWDMIMPLFMFMSGITIPFSMAKYKTGGKQFYLRLLKRLLVLWILGMFVQGNLMDLDIRTLKLFSNTLQSIAVGYVVVALLYTLTSLKVQIIVVSLCFAAYIAVFAIWGGMDFTIGTNICQRIDNDLLGHFRDGVIWNGDQWSFDPDYNYTWILSSLNFIVTVFLGCMTGHVLKKDGNEMSNFWKLVIGGAALIVISFAISPVIPIIKHIWSSSMTLFWGGVSVLLMAICYYLVDIKKRRRGTEWLLYYGRNSIVAYCLASIPITSVTDRFFHGFQQWMGGYYVVLQVLVQVMVIFFILKWMYRRKVFLRA